MNNVDKQYLDLLQDILDNGVYKETRSGAVRSVFGRMMRFNLQDGLPILTTKKVFTKGIIHELLFFIRGDVTIDYLKNNNVHIWDKDCERWDKDDANFVGKIYGTQWRHWGKTKLSSCPDNTPFHILLNKIQKNDKNVLTSKNYGDYVIINDNTVQFLKTGYISQFRKKHIKIGNIKDPYYPNIRGICCLGNIKLNAHNKKYYIIWKGIVDRCYNKTNDNYPYYGGRGVRLSNRWKCFEFFYEDVQKIENFILKEKEPSKYQLDKDIKGNGLVYSFKNCMWSKIEDNIKKSKEKYKYTISNGHDEFSFINRSDFIKKHNIHQGNFAAMLRGKRNKCEGWYLIKKEIIYEKGIDQIQILIDTLKTNPNDRRLIVSAWNVEDLSNMALPPCHYAFQCYATPLNNIERLNWLCEHSNGEYDEWKSTTSDVLDKLNVPKYSLSLMWMQRSVDIALGLPFNITSYAVLLNMIAQCTNMIPNELICSLGDCHIYENQIEGVKEQLTRDPYKYNLPKLWLNPDINNIDDFTFDDIKIEGYESYPSIEFPLSVG